jgi:hypothetical protein
MGSDRLPTRGPTGLDELDRLIAALPRFAPAARFAERVMARVRLPRPWYISIWATVRTHWVATGAAVATLAATTGAAAYLLLSNPTVTPRGLAVFVWEEARQLAWRVVVSVGRLAVDSGIPSAMSGLAEQVQPAQALLALAAFSLLGMCASWMMLRLVRTPITVHAGGMTR